MTGRPGKASERVDILIIVPKGDELYWIGEAFGADLSHPDHLLSHHSCPVYIRSIRDDNENILRVAFVGMEDNQGNVESSIVSSAAVSTLDPSVAVLAGTALGNRKRSGLGDVVFSHALAVVTEPKALDSGHYSWRPRQVEPTGRMRRDIGRYRQSVDIAQLRSRLSTIGRGRLGSLKRRPGQVHLETIASGDILIASPDLAEDLWHHDDRLACYEMEAGGFARALSTYGISDGSNGESSRHDASGRPHQMEWFVVRGISDFGDPSSKSNARNRHIASAAVGVVLLDFLSSGLQECHPFQLRPPTETIAEIPKDHFYVARSGTNFFRTCILEDLGIELAPDQPARNITISALAAMLYPNVPGMTRPDLISYLSLRRSEYFEDKYLGYTYKDDLRSLLPGWALEFREIVRGELNLPRSGLDVLDVGVGNGLEVPDLFGETGLTAASVIGVDVSDSMLRAAKTRFVHLQALVASAENLIGVESRSIDLYVSLRTYMSRLFDIPRALEEAVRVLRPTGGIVLSIANGYVVNDGEGARQLVRGLTVSGSEAVDTEAPHHLVHRLRRHLSDFGFESVGYQSSKTDVYVWGRAPFAHARAERDVQRVLNERVGEIAARVGSQDPA